MKGKLILGLLAVFGSVPLGLYLLQLSVFHHPNWILLEIVPLITFMVGCSVMDKLDKQCVKDEVNEK